MYKLIAIDLDGTLLNSYGEVPKENIEAIKKVTEKGIKVVLASGRISESVYQIAKETGADQYFISGNGAMIYDIQTQNVIYEKFMDKGKILELIKLCEDNSIFYNVYTEDMVIAKSLNYNVAFYYHENAKKAQEKKTNINIVKDVYSYIQKSNVKHFLKMTICEENEIIFKRILRKLKEVSEIEVLDVSHMSSKKIRSGTQEVKVDYYYTEITKKNVDKWYALLEIMKREEIKPEEVMAIGDNMNDLGMIKNAGMGVAMGHSNPQVKEVANFITLDNNEAGVAKAIEEIVL
mgnify:CR=1 FL=1